MSFLSLITQALQDPTKSSRKQTSCDILETVESLGHAVAVAQHHDAITGTEKQYVTEDYHYRLSKQTQEFLHCAAETTLEIGQYNCPYLNISECEVTETQHSFIVSVYNPLPRIRSSIIRLPITYQGDVTVSKMVSRNIILFSIHISNRRDKENGKMISHFLLSQNKFIMKCSKGMVKNSESSYESV